MSIGSFTMLRTAVSESLPTVHEATWITSVTCCLLFHPFPWDAACAMECLVLVGFFCAVIWFMTKKPFLWKCLKRQMSGGYYWLETGGKIPHEVVVTYFFFSFFLFLCSWQVFSLYCNSHIHKLCAHIHIARQNCFQAFLFEHSVMQLALLPSMPLIAESMLRADFSPLYRCIKIPYEQPPSDSIGFCISS